MNTIKQECSIDECYDISYCKNMCHKHYDQMRLYGKTYTTLPKIKLCSFNGCKKDRIAKGLCNSHWAQMKRQGKLSPIYTHQTAEERFRSKFIIDDESGCWVWQLHGTGKAAVGMGEGGYARFSFNNKNWAAHRFSYELHRGVVLNSEDTLDHLCRNTLCVNPEHLEKVTREENTERKHLYHALQSENLRFRKFIASIGYDPEKVLGEIE